jgi:histidinol-phosphate phosphatase family protein
MNVSPRPAVFLDRDGTVSEDIGHMLDPDAMSIFPWTGRAIRRINESGMAAVLVTNQSAVGRGFIDHARVDQAHALLLREIAREGGRLDGIYYCPHHPNDGCVCRKPQPGMLHRAGRELNLELDRSFMIGDHYTDVRAGRAVGARTILVLTGAGAREREEHREDDLQPDYVVPTLADAIHVILSAPMETR